MNIEISTYEEVVEMGELNELLTKMKKEETSCLDLRTIETEAGSLLGTSLAWGKFDIANYLLDNDVPINIVSKDGYNEMHLLAAHINEPGGIELAKRLVEKGIDLSQQEKKYGNTALFTVAMEVLKTTRQDLLEFLMDCVQSESFIDAPNNVGFTVKKVLKDRRGIDIN